MKKYKFTLLLILACLFVACSDDNEQDNKNNNNNENKEKFEFVGRVLASNGYVQEDVKSNFYKNDTNDSYVIYLDKVTFSDKMPLVSFELKDLLPQINREDTLIVMDSVIPYWNNFPVKTMILYNFEARITKDSLIFTSEGGTSSEEGETSLSYRAKRITE